MLFLKKISNTDISTTGTVDTVLRMVTDVNMPIDETCTPHCYFLVTFAPRTEQNYPSCGLSVHLSGGAVAHMYLYMYVFMYTVYIHLNMPI